MGSQEGGIRVPTAITWPGHVPRDVTIDVPTSQMDIFLTLLDLLGKFEKSRLRYAYNFSAHQSMANSQTHLKTSTLRQCGGRALPTVTSRDNRHVTEGRSAQSEGQPRGWYVWLGGDVLGCMIPWSGPFQAGWQFFGDGCLNLNFLSQK